MAKVFLNGRLLEESEANISVFDHGLVVGDGVFETVLLHDGRPFELARHLDRLEHSLAGLGITGVGRHRLEAAVADVAASAEFPRGRLRITVTSGPGPLGSARGGQAPTIIVAVAPAEIDDAPCAVAVLEWTRNEHGPLVGLKTISYAENARALAVAHERGTSEAIFANTAGNLCEGTGSNVFFGRAGELFTPPLSSGCLAGTTRDLLLASGLATEADLPIGHFRPGEIDEAFLASSVRGVQAIATIDGASFDGAPGPLTAAAAKAFAQLLEDALRRRDR